MSDLSIEIVTDSESEGSFEGSSGTHSSRKSSTKSGRHRSRKDKSKRYNENDSEEKVAPMPRKQKQNSKLVKKAFSSEFDDDDDSNKPNNTTNSKLMRSSTLKSIMNTTRPFNDSSIKSASNIQSKRKTNKLRKNSNKNDNDDFDSNENNSRMLTTSNTTTKRPKGNNNNKQQTSQKQQPEQQPKQLNQNSTSKSSNDEEINNKLTDDENTENYYEYEEDEEEEYIESDSIYYLNEKDYENTSDREQNKSPLKSIDDELTISESNLRKDKKREREKNSTENKEKTEDVPWTTPTTINSTTQTFFPKPKKIDNNETQTPLQKQVEQNKFDSLSEKHRNFEPYKHDENSSNAEYESAFSYSLELNSEGEQNQTENETENQINSHLVRREKWKELSKKLRRQSLITKKITNQLNLHTLYHVYTCVNRLNKLKECRKLTKEMEEEIEQMRKTYLQQKNKQNKTKQVKSEKEIKFISIEQNEKLLNKTINKYNGKNNNVFDTENNLTSSTKNNINVNDNNTINDVDIGIKKLEQLIKTKESIYDKFKIDYTEKTIKQLDKKTLISTLKNENYLHETLLGGDGFGFRGKFTKNTFSIGLREGGFAMEQLMTLGIEQNKEMGPIFEALKNGKCIKIETEDKISKEEMAKLTASLKIGNLKAMFNLLNRAKKIYVKEQQCDIYITGKPIQKMLTSVFKLKKAQININYYINEIKAKRNNEITATTKIAETLHKIYNDICSNSTISSKIFENVISINNNENNYVNLVYAVDLIKTVTKNIYRNKADFIGIINSSHQDPLVTVQRLLETAHLEKISRLNKNDEIVEQTESEHEIYNDSVGL